MKQNEAVRKYVEDVLRRYTVARQEIESMCCLTDTIELSNIDVPHLLGIITAMADLLDDHDLMCLEAYEFATGFQRSI